MAGIYKGIHFIALKDKLSVVWYSLELAQCGGSKQANQKKGKCHYFHLTIVIFTTIKSQFIAEAC